MGLPTRSCTRLCSCFSCFSCCISTTLSLIRAMASSFFCSSFSLVRTSRSSKFLWASSSFSARSCTRFIRTSSFCCWISPFRFCATSNASYFSKPIIRLLFCRSSKTCSRHAAFSSKNARRACQFAARCSFRRRSLSSFWACKSFSSLTRCSSSASRIFSFIALLSSKMPCNRLDSLIRALVRSIWCCSIFTRLDQKCTSSSAAATPARASRMRCACRAASLASAFFGGGVRLRGSRGAPAFVGLVPISLFVCRRLVALSSRMCSFKWLAGSVLWALSRSSRMCCSISSADIFPRSGSGVPAIRVEMRSSSKLCNSAWRSRTSSRLVRVRPSAPANRFSAPCVASSRTRSNSCRRSSWAACHWSCACR
mmetsp:Transcript_3427/g.5927  ORF Transcript_3427/g.5927 Transcript_3427/m.5927 type:complete len:368 (+) Transcript_3427:532-1635(+)